MIGVWGLSWLKLEGEGKGGRLTQFYECYQSNKSKARPTCTLLGERVLEQNCLPANENTQQFAASQ